MSKERDALKKAIGIINFTHPNTWHEFISEVQELLAQPEQNLREDLREEPVAWCQLVDGKVQDLLTSFEMKGWLYDESWIPLYIAPPKREPLTSKLISLGNNCHESFIKGVRFAEKMHGIGGGE